MQVGSVSARRMIGGRLEGVSGVGRRRNGFYRLRSVRSVVFCGICIMVDRPWMSGELREVVDPQALGIGNLLLEVKRVLEPERGRV